MMYMKDGEVQTMKLSRSAPSSKPASPPMKPSQPPAAKTADMDESFELVSWPQPQALTVR